MKKKVFLVGVGGIGVSSLAKYLYKNNYNIFGSSNEVNENITKLKSNFKLNFLGEHKSQNIDKSFSFLIYSPAVPKDNPERKEAARLGIKEYSYPEFLGKISENHFTVSVAGTNGKTTTTTMIAEILENFKKDPTVIVGGIAKKFNSNFLAGKSENFIVESCEYKNSFLNLYPDVIAITNITPDHLDYFNTFENYKKAFLNFLDNAKTRKGGKKILICNKSSKNLKEVIKKAEKLKFKVLDYTKYKIKKVTIPGEYNRENAQVALAVVDIFKINQDQVKKYLSEEFKGTKKRFEYLGESKYGALIYDDYAHNPDALKVLRQGIKEKFNYKKNILIFQPHLFSRTEDFYNEFVEEVSRYDIIYILPIYKARENPKDFKINSKMLYKEIKSKNENTFFCENLKSCVKQIEAKKYNENFVIFSVGAGETSIITNKLIK